MNNTLSLAFTKTPTPDAVWLQLTDTQRLKRVQDAISSVNPEANELFMITEAKRDGQVIVRLLRSLAAGNRGGILLDLEEFLKKSVDEGITVWLEALGDRNSLRNLRGIEVKS